MKKPTKSKKQKTASRFKTISQLVISQFKSNPKVKSKELIDLAKRDFPSSKFNVYHYSWYKHQIKVGRYKKLFDSKQYNSIFKTQ